jgi:hypothetical protein
VDLICHSCGARLELTPPLGRRDTCERCSADLHCCRQCKLFDEASSSECREPQAEVPRDKEQANFCEHFVPGSPAPKQANAADAAKAAFEALFKR